LTPFKAWPLPLPAAFAPALGAGALLGCEGEPLPSDFEQAGVTWPARLDAAVPKRRREYLAGRMAAASALSQLALRPGGRWDLATRDDRLPEWPPGVCGSISHSGTLALAWVARAPAQGPVACGGVGVDVEHWLSTERCERLQQRIAPELSQLDPSLLPGTAALTLAFSAKESLFKALYPQVRRYLGFDAAQVLEIEPGGAALRLRLACDWSPDWPAGVELRALAWLDEAAGQVMTLVQLPSVK
jgi:enterobactin synthetase component D